MRVTKRQIDAQIKEIQAKFKGVRHEAMGCMCGRHKCLACGQSIKASIHGPHTFSDAQLRRRAITAILKGKHKREDITRAVYTVKGATWFTGAQRAHMSNILRQLRNAGEIEQRVSFSSGAPVGWHIKITRFCDDCDGCGWVEGGRALKTPCSTCQGSGRAHD